MGLSSDLSIAPFAHIGTVCKHPEVCFTSVTKVPILILVYWDLIGVLCRSSNKQEIS